MSYCRFSSDNFRSDAYVYQSAMGYEVCVAENRVVGDIPCITADMSDIDAFIEQRAVQSAYLAAASREPINLPMAGEWRTFDTPGECADFLDTLRSIGYRVPNYAIATLRHEQELLAP